MKTNIIRKLNKYLQVAALGLSLFGVSRAVAQQQPIDANLKPYYNSVAPLPKPGGPAPNISSPTASALNNTVLPLQFSLQNKKEKELEDAVNNGTILSADQLNTTYGGSPEDAKKVADWLKGSGFSSIEITPDNTSVYASATAAQIQDSLHVNMVTLNQNGIKYVTANSPPQLPQFLSDTVVGIDGLQPWLQAKHHVVPRGEYIHKSTYLGDTGTVATEQGIASSTAKNKIVPRPAFVTVKPFSVKNIMTAYDATGMGVTGNGQTVAILIDTFPQLKDIRLFWGRNGLEDKPDRIKMINVRGLKHMPDRDGEETLDAEWVSGIAPGADVVIYAAGSLEYVDLDRALYKIIDDAGKPGGLRTVSISLGLREDDVTGAELKIEKSIFLRLAALGVTVFVSSGDAGSNPDQTGHARGSDVVVEYEASDSYVVAVGGTTLTLDGNDKVTNEIGWSDSGGGVSGVNVRPPWQQAYSGINSDKRLVPDVSSVADPVPGALVILNTKEYPVGGTSWSTPIWAGFNALLAEKRIRSGQPPLGFLGPVLYRAAATPAIRQITEGSNGAFQAGRGWNPVTGLGVPDVLMLANTLH